MFPICFYPKEEGQKETNPIGYYFVTHNSHPLVHNNIPLKVQIFSSIAATEKCLAIKNCDTACIHILHLAGFVFAAVILPRHRKSISKHQCYGLLPTGFLRSPVEEQWRYPTPSSIVINQQLRSEYPS